jgi:polyhydroxyalkanoate synthesis regulator phasin
MMVSDLEMDMRQMEKRVLALERRVHELEFELNRRAPGPKDYNWI